MAVGRCLFYNGLAVVAGCSLVLIAYTMRIWGRQSNVPAGHPGSRKERPAFVSSGEEQTLDSRKLNDEVTIVTAYFLLGSFQKGEDPNNLFTPDLYRTWMAAFRKIRNPVVAYFDDQRTYSYFAEQRHSLLPLTKLVLLKREDLWSFEVKDEIEAIYRQPNYPVYHPNTVIPEYSCAMHAKYELLLKTVRSNPFKTKYVAWLDLGLFREVNAKVEPPFHIHLPPDFNQSKVAYGLVHSFDAYGRLSDEQIFLSNTVWVCGCFFIGRMDVVSQWAKEYLYFVDYFLQHGLMNTDQQLIFAVHKNHRPRTSIQTYGTDGSGDWFYLGYLCKT